MSYKISFIITSRNESRQVLEATIAGLRETSAGRAREIIVVDDGSITPVFCALGDVMVIRNPQPVGVSRARRDGAKFATGNVLVWLDAHMTFAPDWLNQMLLQVGSGALLCSAFWNYERTVCHGYGADFSWCGDRDYSAQRSPGFALTHRPEFPGPGAVDVPMVIGACYMMARHSYEKMGGFSPLFKIWGVDEQDMSARAWITGCGVQCVTGAAVGHLYRPSFPYRVFFEDLEFNHLAMLRTVFEKQTIASLEQSFDPVPDQVKQWLEFTDCLGWRAVVQAHRQMSDAEFFSRFVPALQDIQR